MSAAEKERHNRACQLLEQRRYDEAEALFRELQAAAPFDFAVNYNYGNLCWESARPVEAMRLWRKAIAAKPDFIPALVNLSNALDSMGDRKEALRYIQMAARRAPDDPRILVNLASVLLNLGEAPHGWEAINHAARIAPDDFMVANMRMTLAVELKLKDEIEGACLAAMRLRQSGHSPMVIAHLIAHYARLSRWDEIAPLQSELHRELMQGTVVMPPLTACFSFDDPELLGRLAQIIALANRHRFQPRPPAGPARDRITIGYLSPDLRSHPVAHMLLPVLRCHDRARFRVLTLGTLPMDASPLSQAILAATDEHIDLSRCDDSQAVDIIRAAGIDILVDLAGSTQWNRPGVLGQRPARTQLLWLGCPATTGMPFYDGFIVDDVVMTPAYAAACTEPLVRLGCCYHPISQGQGEPNPAITRRHLGLPENRFILGLLQLPAKIRPPFTDDLAELLRRLPDAHLWLRTEDQAVPRVKAWFEQRGIAPTRISCTSLIAERRDYLAYPRLADLLIDAYPYGGHSTTGEALALGNPVVTRAGTCMHTRVAASMLHELGLDELIAYDRASFLDTVVRLASDPAALAAMRARTVSAAAAFAENGNIRLTRELERCYAGMR